MEFTHRFLAAYQVKAAFSRPIALDVGAADLAAMEEHIPAEPGTDLPRDPGTGRLRAAGLAAGRAGSRAAPGAREGRWIG